MTLGELAAVLVTLIVGLPGLYWARHEVIEFQEQNRLARLDLENRGVDTNVAHAESVRPTTTSLRIYLPMAGLGLLMIVTWAGIWANQHQTRQIDARLIPFTKASQFFSTLPRTNESVIVWCFPYDPQSCSIALQYKEAFTHKFNTLYWRNEFPTGLSPQSPADFTGINIATAPGVIPPNGARAFKEALDNAGVKSDWKADLTLKPNEFAVWIGRKP